MTRSMGHEVPPKIGFIGFGEAGYWIAYGLKDEGIRELFAFDVMQDHPVYGQKLEEKYKSLGACKCSSENDVVEKAQIIFSAVPSFASLDCAIKASKGMTDGKVFVDVSTAKALDKREAAEKIQACNGLFVDGAMLGALPIKKHRVPMLISGRGCGKLIELMSPYNMDLTCQGEVPGDATNIKLVRSIFTKGISMLAIETVRTAQHFGIEELVVESIKETLSSADFDTLMTRWLGSPILHAKRRADEMKNAIESMDKENLSKIMSEAVKKKLEWMAEQNFGEEFLEGIPNDWKDIVAQWPKP